MSWEQIAMFGLTVKPFDGPKPTLGYRRSLFSAQLRQTLKLLARELDMIYAEQVVVELDVRDRDIRIDGYPRANARPDSPAVRVSFKSKHGPLSYATGEFSDWQDNLRAIALSLEALRAVDRYGVSKRGEQYRGWRAIEMGTDHVQNMTAEEAREFMRRWDGDFTRALFDTHPDRGGDANEVRKVLRARELIGGAA